MNKYFILAIVNCALLMANIFADDLDNQLPRLLKKNIIDAKNSFEKPGMFDTNGRMVRWKTVFQTGIPCPVYESWRTKESPDGKKLQMHLQFKRAVELGTILAFATDKSSAKFTVRGENIKAMPAGGLVVVPTTGAIKYIDFISTSLQHQILFNWGGRKKQVDPSKLSFYQFALGGIYGIKEKRINIAPAASAKVSGISLRRHRENIERSRNNATSLNDRSTYNYWRSNIVKNGETAKAELTFSQAVTVREIGLYIGSYLFKEMPKNIKITAVDSKNKTFDFGFFSDFTNHKYTGRHFYLLRNKYPERKIKNLKFACKPRKDVVFISEIVVLASPEDNFGLSAKSAAGFTKNFIIPAKNQQTASAVIKDKTGRIIKDLAPVVVQDKKFTLAWDGTDNSGRIVAPGQYSLVGITRKKLQVLYESTPYSPAATPWVTPSRRGGWLSDHCAPSTIERIGNQLWVGAPMAESGDCIMQLNLSGKKQWGVRWLNLAGANLMRAYNNQLYVASCGGWIGNKICVTQLNPKSKEFKTILKTAIPDDAIISNNKHHAYKALSGFAVNKAYLALAFAQANRIELYDHKGKKIRNIKILSPGAMRFTKQHNLYVLSNNKLINFNILTGKKQNIITKGLIKAKDFVFDNKNIILADSGDNKIKIFNKSGKLLKFIGANAPRKPGKYNHNILSKPVAVAVDDKNQVWVAEDSILPKRISVWNLKSGKFVREYLGPGKYASGSWLDPQNKDIYYAEGMIFKRSSKGWELDAIYANFTSPTYKLLLKKGNKRLGSPPERAILVDDKLFLARDRYWANAKIWYGIMDKKQVLRPYAAIGSFSELYQNFKQRPKGWWGDPKAYTFLWYDHNRDGEMQWKELQFIEAKFKTLLWSSRLSNKLDFYFDLNDNQLYKLPAVWKHGWPTYDLKQKKLIYKYPAKQQIIALSPLSGNRLLVNTRPLTCLDEKSGKVLWTYPNPLPSNTHDSTLPNPGEIQHTLNTEGLVTIPGFGDVFMLNGNKGLRYLFSVDGIYLGHLFQDMRLAAPLSIETVKPRQDLEKYSLMEEAFNGSFARGSDGRIRFVGGKCHHSIYEIRGLGSLQRFSRHIEFSIDDWQKATQAQSERKAKELNTRIESAPVIKRLSAPIKLSGNEHAWDSIPKQIVDSGTHYKFTYRLALDKNYLYGAFKVTDKSPFANNGSDWKMLFKSGDSINIELGDNNSSDIDVGDIRLLIAPYKQKNIAVLYRYKMKSRTADPTIFGSPVGKVSIDKVEQLTDAQIKVNRAAQGYFVKFKVPRQDIPVLNDHRDAIYGDVGVIFSDSNGSINQYNMFRYSLIKGVTSDVPSEIKLTPKYWHKFNIK